jgi:hypothetical protein
VEVKATGRGAATRDRGTVRARGKEVGIVKAKAREHLSSIPG